MSDQPAAMLGGDGPGLILVVEDDKPTRQLLASVLDEEQLPYRVAATGHEALSLAGQQTPAMVILDMHLPNLQGEAVATAMRMQFGRSLPILIMSASNESPAAERVGAYDFLAKPFDLAELVAKVRRGLELAAGVPARPSPPPSMRVREAVTQQRARFERLRGPEPRTQKSGAAN